MTGVAAGTVTITPAWASITSKPTTIAGYGITDSGIVNYAVGINWTELGQTTTTLFTDDVAIDTDPVPCE